MLRKKLRITIICEREISEDLYEDFSDENVLEVEKRILSDQGIWYLEGDEVDYNVEVIK